jgi:transcriptional regulator with XRE-family HTH domain
MSIKTPDPVDIAIGQRIRSRRLAIGISQEKLGEALGLTFQQVQKYEKGTNRVGGSRMQQIAHALGCTITALHGEGNGKLNEDEALALSILGNNKHRGLFVAYNALPPKEQAVVVNLVTTMAASAQASKGKRRAAA